MKLLLMSVFLSAAGLLSQAADAARPFTSPEFMSWTLRWIPNLVVQGGAGGRSRIVHRHDFQPASAWLERAQPIVQSDPQTGSAWIDISDDLESSTRHGFFRLATGEPGRLEIRFVPEITLNGIPGTEVGIEWVTTSPTGVEWKRWTNRVMESKTEVFVDRSQHNERRTYRIVGKRGEPMGVRPPGFEWIEPGSFTMGSPESESGRNNDEGPQTRITLSRGFWMGANEVTQSEYARVMGVNPSGFKGDESLPVERVSWFDAVAYCAKLTAQEHEERRLPPGWEYRLPTEAEWEYACRAGTSGPFGIGEGNSLSSTQANFDGRYPYGGGAKGVYLAKTRRVGSYPANAWGLYDMHGNVWEWCLDWFSDGLPGGSAADPKGPATGSFRVFRGGSWGSDGRGCRSAFRINFGSPYFGFNLLGFRAVLAPIQP